MNEKLIENIVYSAASGQRETLEIIDADWNDACGLALVIKTNNKPAVQINEIDLPVPIASLSLSFIRWIDSGHFLVAAYEKEEDDELKLYVMATSGKIINSFRGGEGIEDIAVSKEGIWVSYFDQGVFGSGISTEGLVLFSLKGDVLFRYHSDLLDRPDIADCYAICKGKGADIWLFPYTDFPLVEVHPKEQTSLVYVVPEKLHGSKGICTRGKYAYFFSPYDLEQNLYQLEISTQETQLLGTLEGSARGLNPSQKHHFISVSDLEVKLYRIINEDEYRF